MGKHLGAQVFNANSFLEPAFVRFGSMIIRACHYILQALIAQFVG